MRSIGLIALVLAASAAGVRGMCYRCAEACEGSGGGKRRLAADREGVKDGSTSAEEGEECVCRETNMPPDKIKFQCPLTARGQDFCCAKINENGASVRTMNFNSGGSTGSTLAETVARCNAFAADERRCNADPACEFDVQDGKCDASTAEYMRGKDGDGQSSLTGAGDMSIDETMKMMAEMLEADPNMDCTTTEVAHCVKTLMREDCQVCQKNGCGLSEKLTAFAKESNADFDSSFCETDEGRACTAACKDCSSGPYMFCTTKLLMEGLSQIGESIGESFGTSGKECDTDEDCPTLGDTACGYHCGDGRCHMFCEGAPPPPNDGSDGDDNGGMPQLEECEGMDVCKDVDSTGVCPDACKEWSNSARARKCIDAMQKMGVENFSEEKVKAHFAICGEGGGAAPSCGNGLREQLLDECRKDRGEFWAWTCDEAALYPSEECEEGGLYDTRRGGCMKC